MVEREQLLISLSDLVAATRKHAVSIALLMLIIGSLGTLYKASRPKPYVSVAEFKGGVSDTVGMMGFGFLAGSGAPVGAGSEELDPKLFLTSYPILEYVVDKEHLQGTLSDASFIPQFSTLRTNWLAEKRRQLPPLIALNCPILIEAPSLAFSSLSYNSLYISHLSLEFISPTSFKVEDEGRYVGEGKLNHSFTWKEGSFTLTSKETDLKGKQFTMELLPKSLAIGALKSAIQVEKSSENIQLVDVRFSHENPYLAQRLLTSLMESFQQYMKEEARAKIDAQLDYLSYREEGLAENLEKNLHLEKTRKEASALEGLPLTLEQRIEQLSEDQFTYSKQRSTALEELESLGEELFETTDLESLRKAVAHCNLSDVAELPLRHTIASLEGAAEQLRNKQAFYHKLLARLALSDFSTTFFLEEPISSFLSEKLVYLESLSKKLLETHWSQKERAFFQQEINNENAILSQRVLENIESLAFQEKSHQEEIRLLKPTLLALTLNRYDQLSSELNDVSQKLAQLPIKKLEQNKLEKEIKQQEHLLQTLLASVESKNLGFHLEGLKSKVITPATLPMAPESPKMGKTGFMLGIIVGVLAFFLVWAREVIRGPSSSPTHLKEFGYKSCKIEQVLKEKIICVGSKHAYDLSPLFDISRVSIVDDIPSKLDESIDHYIIRCTGSVADMPDGAFYILSDERLHELRRDLCYIHLTPAKSVFFQTSSASLKALFEHSSLATLSS